MTEFIYSGYTIEVGRQEQQNPKRPPLLIRHIDAFPEDPTGQMATVTYCVGVCGMDGSLRLFSDSKVERFKRQAWDDLVALLGRDKEMERFDEICLQIEQEDRQG